MEGIENKIANSGLVNFDLEKLYIKGKRVNLDISNWLWNEMIIKEKEFRQHLEQHDWMQYTSSLVYITCKADAIVPNWAYMLVAQKLTNNCIYFHLGSLEEMETVLFNSSIEQLDLNTFKDARVLLKGCSEAAVPSSAYVALTQKLLPIVKSLMFGEACSNVPIYKAKKINN